MQRKIFISQIEDDIKSFQNILQTQTNKNILEEEILHILWEIEEKVSQIIWNKKLRTAQEKEAVFQRYLSLNKIESKYTSIDDFLDELIAKLAQELTQRKIQLTHDLFEKGTAQIEWNGETKEKIELQTSPKNKIFLRVLHKMWIDFWNVQEYEEQLNPKRMRQIPYKIYHIENWGTQKTVLICDQIGQATFVYDAIIEPAIFQVIEKWEEIDWNKALKIIYNKKTYENNLERALNTTLTFEEKEKQIVNEEEEKADEKKEILTKEELFKKLWNYEWRSEQESYDFFMWLWSIKIAKIKIWWNKVHSLKTLSWIEIEWVIIYPSVFQEWIEKIFEWKDIVKITKLTKEILTKEELFKKLWNYEWRSEQESYDFFMGWWTREIKALKIWWNRVTGLKSISWIEIEWEIKNISVFQEWIEKIFEWKDIVKITKLTKEILTKEELFKKLWNYEWRSEQESYDFFMGWWTREIKALKIWWNKVTRLKSISWIEIEWEGKNPSVFQEWIEKIFEWKGIVRIEEFTKEELFKKLWNYEWRSMQESYDFFMWLWSIKIAKIEIWWNKVHSLKTLSWIEIEWNINTLSVFQEWIEKVFEGKDIVRKTKKQS